MQIHLIRNAEADFAHATDPDSARLSAAGREQAQRVAHYTQDTGVELFCCSAMWRSQETADAISDLLPDLLRWDLDELEDLTHDDLHLDPSASHMVRDWNPEQRARGLRQMWTRIMPVWTRVLIYAQTNGLQRIAYVSHATVLRLFLLNALERDWRDADSLRIQLDWASASRITLDGTNVTGIDWINRPL